MVECFCQFPFGKTNPLWFTIAGVPKVTWHFIKLLLVFCCAPPPPAQQHVFHNGALAWVYANPMFADPLANLSILFVLSGLWPLDQRRV